MLSRGHSSAPGRRDAQMGDGCGAGGRLRRHEALKLRPVHLLLALNWNQGLIFGRDLKGHLVHLAPHARDSRVIHSVQASPLTGHRMIQGITGKQLSTMGAGGKGK